MNDAQAQSLTSSDALVWADIENPPQVQYLLPILGRCRERGALTFVTARDYGDTFEMLRERGEPFEEVGQAYGVSRGAKALGLARRSGTLVSRLRATETPSALICASRAAVLAARMVGIPSFVIEDYEHSNTTAYRLGRPTVLYPDVIDPDVFRRKGLAAERLVPFRGLKEDLTFAGIDLSKVRPAQFVLEPPEDVVRVLLRPPAEESHYYHDESRSLTVETLRYLASQRQVVVVLSPRYPRHSAYLEGLRWSHEPIVLTKPVPTTSLLTAVDVVICSGGTMLREAAYLGIPAYSIFRSEVGAVDRYLESIGRSTLLTSAEDLGAIRLERRASLAPLHSNPGLVDEIASRLLAAAWPA